MTGNPCVRSAWLVLGALTVPLESAALGYFCSKLDLAAPNVRAVTNPRPDQDGTDDRTAYMADRAVNVEVLAVHGAGAQMDAVAASFAPFMAPSARPVLHYVLDRPGNPERTMTLRAAALSWPIAGGETLDIQLQWVAPDPAAYNPVLESATAWPGSATVPGRSYPWTPPRVYPAGGLAPTPGAIYSPGDLSVSPVLTIYGPITTPSVTITSPSATVINITAHTGYVLGAGQYVTVDLGARTAVDNTGLNVLNQLDWGQSVFGVIPPQTNCTMNMTGTSATWNSQVVATWHDAYLL